MTAPQWREKCLARYGFDPLEEVPLFNDRGVGLRTGEDMLFQVADNTCQGNPEDAARKILQDFRAGRIGPVCLQVAPETEEDQGQLAIPVGELDYERFMDDDDDVGPKDKARFNRQNSRTERELEREQLERAKSALEAAKERGLELPPLIENPPDASKTEGDVGKGLFEGW